MAKQDYTRHQEKIINRYYENNDTIQSTRLSEIVSDLYLADTAKKQASLWKRAGQALKKIGVDPKQIEHVLEKQDVTLLAKIVSQADAGRASGQR